MPQQSQRADPAAETLCSKLEHVRDHLERQTQPSRKHELNKAQHSPWDDIKTHTGSLGQNFSSWRFRIKSRCFRTDLTTIEEEKAGNSSIERKEGYDNTNEVMHNGRGNEAGCIHDREAEASAKRYEPRRCGNGMIVPAIKLTGPEVDAAADVTLLSAAAPPSHLPDRGRSANRGRCGNISPSSNQIWSASEDRRHLRVSEAEHGRGSANKYSTKSLPPRPSPSLLAPPRHRRRGRQADTTTSSATRRSENRDDRSQTSRYESR